MRAVGAVVSDPAGLIDPPQHHVLEATGVVTDKAQGVKRKAVILTGNTVTVAEALGDVSVIGSAQDTVVSVELQGSGEGGFSADYKKTKMGNAPLVDAPPVKADTLNQKISRVSQVVQVVQKVSPTSQPFAPRPPGSAPAILRV